ncbi:PREDICTED: basic blue [Prunus dulcis]|uniref:PREDICTED: basic blue n=1 Tax=Prunus dulcis TaxID=3755 RepID=A0A5E4EHF4_PRUDU|nr:PREDICTED: basic blue [Prunus dulcis]
MGEIPNEIEIHIHCHLPTSREYLTKLIMNMGMAAAGFAPDFYNDTCPAFHSIIKSAVKKAVEEESRIGWEPLNHNWIGYYEACDLYPDQKDIYISGNDHVVLEKGANALVPFDISYCKRGMKLKVEAE